MMIFGLKFGSRVSRKVSEGLRWFLLCAFDLKARRLKTDSKVEMGQKVVCK